MPEPQFEAQTKIRLNNPEVEGIVASVVHEQLSKFLEENPKEAQKLMKKVILAAEAREAAAKAKKALKDRKNILNSTGLPGKLMDCTSRDRDESELFLVEGQSAGGSAESGRDRFYQAILPLRGKVLNVEKARQEKVLGNEELCNLISAVGVDIGGAAEDVDKRRYGKVVLLTDADVDGQHIRTLLLTFFYRQMRNLVEAGHIYVARPPLYKVEQKKQIRFVQTMDEMTQELLARGLDGTYLTVHGTGGAGAAEQRVIDGERLTKLVEVLSEVENSILILERRGLTLGQLLAKATPAGLPLFRVVLAGQGHWFPTAQAVDKFRQEEQAKRGHEFVVADELRPAVPSTNGNGHPIETFFMQELHEVRTINRCLEKLKAFGFAASDLIPLPRIAGREPLLRFMLGSGDNRLPLSQLRDLPSEIRRNGERGMKITRFKGLGEMDPEELWETTLDPAKRTLIKVQLEDALKAEEMFRTLMGEKVEPRREFIQKHALEVKEIDYHGAWEHSSVANPARPGPAVCGRTGPGPCAEPRRLALNGGLDRAPTGPKASVQGRRYPRSPYSHGILTGGKELGRSAGLGNNHCASTSHRFHDRQAKRLRLRAGMHHDVQRAIHFNGIGLERHETNAPVEPESVRTLPQLLRGVLGCRQVNGAADNVETHRQSRCHREARRPPPPTRPHGLSSARR